MPPSRATARSAQAGFTLIETMVAALVLIVGLVSTLTVVEQADSTTRKTRAREQATNLQRELVEAARSVTYDQLTPNGLGAAVRARPALGDSSFGGAGWTIRRRDTTYTVSVGACTVDDPGDGVGSHPAGAFCAAGATPTDVNADGTLDGLASNTATTCNGAACDANAADFKRVVSVVTWPGGSNVQTTQVNNPGLSAAPAVTSLTAATTTVTDTRTSLALAATTTNLPATVALYVDGTNIAPATSTGPNAWAGSWDLGSVTATVGGQPAPSEVVDGSYELSAKAFDSYGQFGAPRSQTVTLNRRQAFAPAYVEAGRNGTSIVEIEWSPAREHDSEGFSVERRSGSAGSWSTVCARAVQTACRDLTAPLPGAQPLQYSVVGWDRDSGGALRAGDRSEIKDVDPAQAAPGTPVSLQATLVGGDVRLTWTSPGGLTTQQPSEINVPDHYNIYRDGAFYPDRLDGARITNGQPLAYLDTHTTGQVHTYWITAVNDRLRESPVLGPVVR